MSLVQLLKDKGYLYQVTNAERFEYLAQNGKIVAYLGIDCTAASLHAGHLVPIMLLKHLQAYGNKIIVLIGGGTSKLGDPTGKDKMRKILNQDEIATNIVGIKQSLAKFLNFSDNLETEQNNLISTSDHSFLESYGISQYLTKNNHNSSHSIKHNNGVMIVNNHDWLEQINYLDFLTTYGRNISVNKMLTMDSVSSRLEREQPLSFLEFNYMLLQAYDFLHLNKHFNCNLQIGGSDQWGNIIMGIDLIAKTSTQQEALVGLTTPLITTSSGAKMGKSESGAVWLNADHLSPYGYYQYWRNVEDNDVIRFSKTYADFDDSEQNYFNDLVKTDINSAKKALAWKLTMLCHGREEANKALKSCTNIFEKGEIDQDMPTFFLDLDELNEDGIELSNLLVNIDLVQSRSEAKNLIQGGGVRINDLKIEDPKYLVTDKLFIKIDTQSSQDKAIKITIGRKKHVLLKIKENHKL